MIAETTLRYFDEKIRQWRQAELDRTRMGSLGSPRVHISAPDPAVRRREYLLSNGITVGLLTDVEVRELIRRRSKAT
jgi:hypothetical protein